MKRITDNYWMSRLSFSYSQDGKYWVSLPFNEWYQSDKEALAALEECYNAMTWAVGDRVWNDKVVEELHEGKSFGYREWWFTLYIRQAGVLEGYYRVSVTPSHG